MLRVVIAAGKLLILCGTKFGTEYAYRKAKTKWRRKGLQPRILAEPLLI